LSWPSEIQDLARGVEGVQARGPRGQELERGGRGGHRGSLRGAGTRGVGKIGLQDVGASPPPVKGGALHAQALVCHLVVEGQRSILLPTVVGHLRIDAATSSHGPLGRMHEDGARHSQNRGAHHAASRFGAHDCRGLTTSIPHSRKEGEASTLLMELLRASQTWFLDSLFFSTSKRLIAGTLGRHATSNTLGAVVGWKMIVEGFLHVPRVAWRVLCD